MAAELLEPNYALRLMGDITATGIPVTASNHSRFRKLPDFSSGEADPSTIVSWRKHIITELGSGAVSSLLVERVTAEGARYLLATDAEAILGIVNIAIEAERPYVESDRSLEVQSNYLRLGYISTKAIPVSAFESSVPMDEKMREETAAIWSRWGFEMDYANDVTGGYLLIYPQPGMVRNQLEQLQELRAANIRQ